MDPNVEKFVIESLLHSKDIVIAEAPLVVREVIHWAIISGVAWSLVWCAVFVVLAVTAYRCRAVVLASNGYADDGLIIGGVVAVIGAIPAALFSAAYASQALQAYIAPRAYLLQMVIQ